jgi:hypothetical protein
MIAGNDLLNLVTEFNLARRGFGRRRRHLQ